MVQLKLFSIFVLLASSETSSEFEAEESKKIVTKAKYKFRSEAADHFQCDLELLPEQREAMYLPSHIRKSDGPRELYKWPKDKEGFVIVPYRISYSSFYCKYFDFHNLCNRSDIYCVI